MSSTRSQPQIPSSTLDKYFSVSKTKTIPSPEPQIKKQLKITKFEPKNVTIKVIIPFPQQDQSDLLDECFDRIKKSICSLVENSDIEYSQCFKDIQMYSSIKGFSNLFDFVVESIKSLVESFVSSLVVEFSGLSDQILLFSTKMESIRKLFILLDRSYLLVKRPNGYNSVTNIAFSLLHDYFEKSDKIPDILNQLQISIERMRNGDSVHLETIINFFVKIKIFDQFFSDAIISQTHKYYSDVVKSISTDNFVSFFNKALKRENHLKESGIPQQSFNLIQSSFSEVCLKRDSLFDNFDLTNTDLVSSLYSFYKSAGIQEFLFQKITNIFRNKILHVFKMKENQWIRSIISLLAEKKDFLDHFNSDFSIFIQKGLQEAIREKSDKVSKLLAFHFNLGENTRDEEIEIFKLLHDCNVFRESYRILLGKRIISKRSIDVKREENLLNALKKVAGNDFIVPLTGLITDFLKSSNLNEGNYHCIVLSTTYFPNANLFEVKLPSPIDSMHKAFVSQYKTIYPHRILRYAPTFTQVDLQLGESVIHCSGDQALIILQLEKSSFSQSQLVQQTGLGSALISKNVELLSCLEEKDGIIGLDKEPFNSNEVFLPLIEKESFQEEKKSMDEFIQIKRLNSLRCAIVHSLKISRKQRLKDLLEKARSELSFSPTEEMFQEAVRDLVDRGHIFQIGSTTTYSFYNPSG